jgi:hypothetical protein
MARPREITKLRAERERFLVVFTTMAGNGYHMDSRGSQEEVWEMLKLLKKHLDSRFPGFYGFYHKPFPPKET